MKGVLKSLLDRGGEAFSGIDMGKRFFILE